MYAWRNTQHTGQPKNLVEKIVAFFFGSPPKKNTYRNNKYINHERALNSIKKAKKEI